MCSDNESDGRTDNKALQAHAFHTTTPDTLEVCAHIELVAAYAQADTALAILDSEADSCVVGENTYIMLYTGRYATLIGYDPATTKSARIPIVTAVVKA